MAKAKVSGPRLYEGLFLLNQHAVAADFPAVIDHVKEFFTRASAELVVLRKWDERRLAYEISGQKRGTFLLTYFNAEGNAVAHIERDVTLSEKVLRCLITRADHIGEIELKEAADGAELTLEFTDSDSSSSAPASKPDDSGEKDDVSDEQEAATEAAGASS